MNIQLTLEICFERVELTYQKWNSNTISCRRAWVEYSFATTYGACSLNSTSVFSTIQPVCFWQRISWCVCHDRGVHKIYMLDAFSRIKIKSMQLLGNWFMTTSATNTMSGTICLRILSLRAKIHSYTHIKSRQRSQAKKAWSLLDATRP